MSKTKVKKITPKKRKRVFNPPFIQEPGKIYCRACRKEVPEGDLKCCPHCGCIRILEPIKK